MVANTAVSASTSGMNAPTSEPNTSSRITSVIGIEIIPARASCELNISSSALPVDAEPASTTVKSGFAFCTCAVPATIVSM